MTTSINVFPKRLTIFGLLFLSLILGFTLYSQLRTSQLLNSFQSNDIPTLQLSCAVTRVMSETEQLLEQTAPDQKKISSRAYVLEDSLKDLLYLTGDFPEVPAKFSVSPNYLNFQKFSKDEFKEINHNGSLAHLKGDVQTLVEDYLLHKNEVIKQHIFFGKISSLISLVGVLIFFFLIYVIYRRYQRNIESLEVITKSLEHERLATVQSSKLASLGEMAAGLAHEINNPLAVIIGRAEMVMAQISEGSATDVEISKTITKINDMALRISKIVTSMRKISKGADQNELIPTNLSSVIDDILNLSSERIRNSVINLDISGVDKQLTVRANFTHLSQVIINLLNNSIDELSKVPEEKRNIWLTSEEFGNEAFLKIKDSGPGIPQDVREKLFQPFFTTKEIGKGTGLGLSISKGLMIGMGGDLVLAPELNPTCFILKFKN